MNTKHLQGIFPVFKPAGVTSAQLLEIIKTNLKTENTNSTPIKMGHGGTLDKSATGVLVVGINQGCSKLPAFIDGGKTYLTSCLFGKATSTYNSEGEIMMEKPFDHIHISDVINSLQAFKGQVLQKPPAYSALKFQGKRFSDLVREGMQIEPEPRLVYCYDFKVINFTSPSLIFEIFCGRGFYIRSLVHDLGIDSCAHVNKLERLRQGPFEIAHCLKGEEYTSSNIYEKISQMQELVDNYVDVQMDEFRSLLKTKTKPHRIPKC